MRFFIALGLMLVSMTAMAQAPQVCVRDYRSNQAGFDPCESGRGIYVYVVGADSPEAKVCVQAYPALSCQYQPQSYRFALGVDGDAVCVVHYDQPGVGNYCEAAPGQYTYVPGVE
jgi:hypothetical protein